MNALDTINSRPDTRALYAKLLDLLDDIGPYDVEVKKTSLHITNGPAFLGVHPRATGLLVNLVTEAPLDSAGSTGRVRRTDQVSAHRFHNEVLVAAAADLDEQLVDWIRRAYQR